MSGAQKKQSQNASRWKNGLCGAFACVLLVVSALSHVAVAAHARTVTHDFCMRPDLASYIANDQASDRHAKLAVAHCDACAMAAAPVPPEKSPVAEEQRSVRLVPSYARAFELIERRRAGETRSRAPPQFS